MTKFATQYGPWAVVAGASEGLGEAFAKGIAARGVNVVLIARRKEALDQVAAAIQTAHPAIAVRVAAIDLARPDLITALGPVVEDIEVGLVVCNAARSVIGRFEQQPLADHLNVIDVNVRSMVALAHYFGRQMVTRRRGGIITMSSLAAGQGSPFLSTYAASKAYALIFAEALWHELRPHGVDVLACRAGATKTPNYDRAKPQGAEPPMMSPEAVVAEALDELGRKPSFIAGWKNKLAIGMLGLLSRRQAIDIMGRTTARMYPDAINSTK